MATTDIPSSSDAANNHTVCSECWEMFLTNEELESHQNTCHHQLLLGSDGKSEDTTADMDDHQQQQQQNLSPTADDDQQNMSDLSDKTESDLTVLKVMPPQTEVMNSQNGELLAVFNPSDLVHGGDPASLDNFTITLPASTILSSYIQQQQNEQDKCDPNNSDSISKESQSLLTQCLLENGVINQVSVNVPPKVSTALTTVTATKSSSKRKLLPKPVDSLDQFSQIFQCTRCDFVFYNDASYRDHARSHAKVKEFACEYCGITLTKYEQMAKHLDKEHNSDLSYYCYLCCTPADDKFSLQEHLKYCGKNNGGNTCSTGKSNQSTTTSLAPALPAVLPSTSQLLPNFLSGSTIKFGVDAKNLIVCPKCGQVLGTEESLNVNEKPVDHQCKYCATNLTLMRQTSVHQQSLSDTKLLDIFNQTTTGLAEETLTMTSESDLPSLNTAAIPSAGTTQSSTPLLLYPQSNNPTSFPTQSPSPSMNLPDTTVSGGLPPVNISTVSMDTSTTNHMTVGISTSNGLMVLTLPVVTTDKVPSNSSSVTAPMLQLPTGNIILLGTDVGGSLNLGSTTGHTNLSSVVASAQSPVLPSNDILMTATAGINAPSDDTPGLLPLTLSTLMDQSNSSIGDPSHDLKTKLPRYTCSHCGKTFELYQSWKRHEQKHTVPKKQHSCSTCGKTFSRPGQLKDHMMKMHKSTSGNGEANNNDVQMIKMET